MLFKVMIRELSILFLLSFSVNVDAQEAVTTTPNTTSASTTSASTTSASTTNASTTSASTTSASTTTFAPPIKEHFLDDADIYTWTSLNYPQPYLPDDDYLIIKADKGYYVSITVEDLDLDGGNGDFLLVKPGTTLDDGRKGKIFTYHLNSERKYLLDFNGAYLGFYVFGKNEIKKKGFSLKYQRVGEVISTTTAYPTTVINWPTPSGSDSIYYTAYVSGKAQDDFNNNQVLDNFKTALANMATEYCATNNFVLSENITTSNVQIYYLNQCPYTWPDGDKCVQVRFAIPVFVAENSPWTGYQLTTAHLEQMWSRLANKHLEKYNMSAYVKPDNDSSLTMWVVISCLVIIVFLILLYIVKMVGHNFSPLKSMKRRSSDTSNIIPNQSRTSKISLRPHPLQVTPPFFDNDYSFQQYEPDVNIPSNRNGYPLPLSEDDSDNEIIFTNFSNSRNNIPENNKESLS